jgi:hypothetical protein
MISTMPMLVTWVLASEGMAVTMWELLPQ